MNKDTTNVKTCSVCHKPRKNDTYGERCEDCYCEGIYSTQGMRSGLYPKGTRVVKNKPQR